MNAKINQVAETETNVSRPNFLKPVGISDSTRDHFCNKYSYTADEEGFEKALEDLNSSFFGYLNRNGKGSEITRLHRLKVIASSVETGLSPYNDEIYPIMKFTGDIKIVPTIDGWLKLAANEPITNRDFVYSDDTVDININGHTYNVPAWIECVIEHKERGKSKAREYFLEVFNNSQNNLPSWSRPARMLGHVAFVQALRKMLKITSLSDSDIVSDIHREYEMLHAQQMSQSNSNSYPGVGVNPQPSQRESLSRGVPTSPKPHAAANSERPLNIPMDKVEVIATVDGTAGAEPLTDINVSIQDEGEDQVELPSEQVMESPEDASRADDAPVVEDEPAEPQVKAKQDESAQLEPEVEQSRNEVDSDEEINELSVPRNIVSMAKPMIQATLNGQRSFDALKAFRNAITDTRGKKWFDQQVTAVAVKLNLGNN